MIKFNCLIHKETGTVIKHEDWKEAAKDDSYITIKDKEVFVNPKNIVKAKGILFSDDFEIIYDSEFTQEELTVIFNGHQDENDKLMKKIHTNVYDKEFLKLKYGIEV